MNNLFHQGPTASDSLGRYYTHERIGELLVGQMSMSKPKRILDLGSGQGALSKAAIERWGDCELVTVDVDRAVSMGITKSIFGVAHHTKHHHICADVLGVDLHELVESQRGFDAAVCNPPFIIPEWSRRYSEIIEEAGFSGCISGVNSADAALLFLSQNFRLLNEGAMLGIILPDSLVSSIKYKGFRSEILRRYSINRVVKLPRRSFRNTDALAYAVVVSKKRPDSKYIELAKYDDVAGLSRPIFVEVEAAERRMDFDFHFTAGAGLVGTATVADIVSELKRGVLSSAALREAKYPVFHTTNMGGDGYGRWCDLREFGEKKSRDGVPAGAIMASPGDILLARVGRNLETKVMGVKAGYPILSDCVFKLRVISTHRDDVLRRLSSAAGAAWLSAQAYGVSAKQITKTDILSFPINK